MSKFFTRERFGQPQVFAGILLLAFLAQCVWLIGRGAPGDDFYTKQIPRMQQGLQLWGRPAALSAPNIVPLHGGLFAGLEPAPAAAANADEDENHSRLWYLAGSAPLLLLPGNIAGENLRRARWLASAPELLFGVLLGASLWYVARRLYGNAGGYIALGLYCFSPAVIRAVALFNSPPEMAAAWGSFGAIFTAIAVAHTLYAPREVVFWNWRRILLLALSFVLAVGSQFSLIVLVPCTLGFLLYLAPTRRSAALAIWAAGCAVSVLLLFASYGFHLRALRATIVHANFFGLLWPVYRIPQAYSLSFSQLLHSSPAALIAFAPALAAYAAWRRTRYFGNTAPLLVAVLFLLLAVGMPHYPGAGFHLMALPFIFVFVAGVCADLLETRYREPVLAVVIGLLTASALWNLWALIQIPPV